MEECNPLEKNDRYVNYIRSVQVVLRIKGRSGLSSEWMGSWLWMRGGVVDSVDDRCVPYVRNGDP